MKALELVMYLNQLIEEYGDGNVRYNQDDETIVFDPDDSQDFIELSEIH